MWTIIMDIAIGEFQTRQHSYVYFGMTAN